MRTGGKKTPKPDFHIRLVGPGIKPWKVPFRTLSRILAAAQRLVEQRDDLADAEEEDEGQELVEQRTLQLLQVKSRSAGYAVSSNNPQQTIPVLRATGKSIEHPERAEWRPSTISSVDELSQMAKQLGCVIEFREPSEDGTYGDVIAMIRSDTFSEIQKRAFEYGHTSVFGRLERVGGSTAMKCGIHVQGRPRMLFCDVANTTLIRDLGKYIYTDVVLTGEAVWYRFNRQLKSMMVNSFSPAKTESLEEVAKRIREAGGFAWDKISDPNAYLREMRG